MSKYIDLELALNELLRLYEEDVERYGVEIPETFDYQGAREVLLNLTTIDIVRCEDCRHATYSVKNKITHETFYACPYSCVNHEGKFFCSYGERKDNEQVLQSGRC